MDAIRFSIVVFITLATTQVAPGDAATVTSRDGARMVLVPAGTFIMGTADAEPDARPPHRQHLPAFYIDAAEVTVGQYARFIDETGTEPPPDWHGSTPPEGRGHLPMTNITWFDAMRYAIWAGKRLPTEAEWEKAARGEDGRRYPWGNRDQKALRNLQESKRLEPGDSRPEGASPYGVMHMSGNAWEWTADWYAAYPGSSTRSVHFGRHYKVVRGGGAEYLYGIRNDGTTTARARLLPYGAHDFIGFRCVKDVDPTEAPYDPAERLAEAEAQLRSFDRKPVRLSYETEFAGLLEKRRIPLEITGSQGREGCVRTGIPFPEGLLDDVSMIRVLSANGETRPVQTRLLAPWEDGSVRWALLDFPARAGETCELVIGEPGSMPADRGLQIEETGKNISIDTGALSFSISPDALVHEVRHRGRPWLEGMKIRVDAEADGARRHLHALPAEEVILETPGPLRAVVRLRGSLGDDDGTPSDLTYDVRVHALAQSARMHVLVTLTHMAARESRDAKVLEPMLEVRDAAVVFERPTGTAETTVALDRGVKPVKANRRIEVRQDDSLKFRILADGEVDATGQHAPGWLAVPDENGWMAFGARYFWQNHPDALVLTPDSLALRMWTGESPFEWEATLAKTHEIVIDAIESPERGFEFEPLRATLPPAWTCGTEAIGGPLLPRCRESIARFPYWELMREATMQQFVKGMPTGLRDFGDAYMGGPYKGKNAFLNLEYDVSFNFLLQFLRTGEGWYLDAAEPMARHQADIDTDHVTGQPYKHSPLHTTTRADIAHMFIRGLLLHHALTGEERSLDVARKIGDHICARTMHRDGYGNERQIGWGLYALTGLYDMTRDDRYLEAARFLCHHLAAGQSPTGKFDIRWDNRIAFMNGLAMGGMLTVHEHTGDDKIADMILRVARRTWGMYPEYACRTLNAYCWGLEQTHDPRYLDTLERTWVTTMDYLRTAVSVETFAWRFTDFAARYRLLPLFEQDPELLPDPANWRGLQLTGAPVEMFLRPAGDQPAPVMVLLKGLVAGEVELFDVSGRLVETHKLSDETQFLKPVVLKLQGKDRIYRMRLTGAGARNWQVHYDDRCQLTMLDPEGRHLHELNPRAFGFVRPGAGEVRLRLEVMNEGYHMATLYDADGNVVATATRFVDFEDPGRYVIELQAPVSGDVSRPWSLQIYDAKIIEMEGMLPYWATDPDQLFNFESK